MCFFALSFSFLSPLVATAQHPHAALRAAESLLSDTCELHSLLEARRADAYTIRSASRLESTVEELIEKLQCSHSEAAIAMLMDDCILWYKRTSVGIRRDCRLEDDRGIASVMACAGRQLSSLEDAIACFLRDSRHDTGHHYGHNTGHAARASRDSRWNDPRYGAAQLHLPGQPGTWVSGPIGEQRVLNYPYGTGVYGHPGFDSGTQLRAQPGFGPGVYSSPAPTPFQARPPQSRGNQGLGLSVLESVLSELARSR